MHDVVEYILRCMQLKIWERDSVDIVLSDTNIWNCFLFLVEISVMSVICHFSHKCKEL